MAKIHTKVKRLWAQTNATKKTGDKTFKTQEAAEEYKKANKLTGDIIPAKKGKKFKVEK